VLGVFQGCVTEQRVDRRQSGVAGADAVAALEFQVIEEAGDQGRVEVGQVQLRGRQPGSAGGVLSVVLFDGGGGVVGDDDVL
jgi:hypothetical protein